MKDVSQGHILVNEKAFGVQSVMQVAGVTGGNVRSNVFCYSEV